MSSNTLSTHQLDRQAQQRLQAARQHASTSGQAQGAAFQKLLMLAADEDSDADSLQARGAKALLAGDTEDTSSGTTSARGRANGRRAGQASADEEDAAALARGADSPAANAALMALLERATSGATTPAESGDGATDALQAQAAANDTPLATGDGPAQAGDTPPELVLADGEEPATPARPAVGRSTRELAQMLSAQHDNAAQASGTRTGPATGNDTTATGTAALADTSTPPTLALDPRAAQATDAPTTPAAWASAQRDAPAADAAPEGGEASDALGLEGTSVVSDAAPGAETRHQHGNTSGDLSGNTDSQPVSAAPEDSTSPQAEAWRQQWQDTMDQVAHQVSYWMGQGVHQANLRVASGAAQTMDVKLSLKGGKADLEFRTDHEQARQALNDGGTDVLRQWLAQGGIDLGQVSVSAGGTGTGNDGSGQQPSGTNPPQARAQDTRTGGDGVAATPQAARVANGSSSGLDLYV